MLRISLRNNMPWKESNEELRYIKEDGAYAQEEWLDINGFRYYFDFHGNAATGECVINAKRFFFETSGIYKGALMVSDPKEGLKKYYTEEE